MIYNKFDFTNNLLENVAHIAATTARINSRNLNSSQEKQLRKHTVKLNIFHLAHLLNYELSLKTAEKFTEGKSFDYQSYQEIILANFRNVIDFTKTTLQDEYIDIDISIVLHFNKLLLQNWRESWDVKFRTVDSQNENTAWNNWYHLLDQTVELHNLQDEISAVFEWYKYNSSKINDLLRAGILLFNLVKLQPFHVGNKITILATADFLCKKNSLLPRDYFAAVRLFDINDMEIINYWQQIDSPEADLTDWLELYTRKIAQELDNIQKHIDKIQTEAKSSNKGVFLDLNKRQLKILKYLQTIPTVRREDYVNMMSVSSMTAFRDLTDLVDKNLLAIEGKGRATRYRLSHR